MTEQEKREKVIALLERYVDAPNLAGVENYGAKIADMPAPLIADALALLKTQEPVKPKWEKGYAYCGKCGYKLHWIVDLNNYCPNCGRAVKWDDK